jgi:hypothetical protein
MMMLVNRWMISGLPSSFKGQHGFISYYVSASIVDDVEVEPLMKTKSINVPVRSGIRKPDLVVSDGTRTKFFLLFLVVHE